ncbi:unnamed protein product [Auanema sp. JU1783]|nr:unnamed protein product [Auanema sp. JU1783]
MPPSAPSRGKVTCIIGPMFSGKTTELLRLHDRQIIAKRSCVLIKYAGDTRYDANLVATHTKVTGRGTTLKANRLIEVEKEIFDPNVQVVSIDEGQFFSDLADVCERLAQAGKLVYVAALNGTFERKIFPQIGLLLPFCDDVIQVVAVCMECGADACYTFRSTKDKKVEVIGGEDTYKALCRVCYYSESEKRDLDDVVNVAENLTRGSFCRKAEEGDIPRKVFIRMQ